MTPEIAPICLLFEDCIFEASDVSDLSVASYPPHPSAKAKIKTEGVISWSRSGVFVPLFLERLSGGSLSRSLSRLLAGPEGWAATKPSTETPGSRDGGQASLRSPC